MADEKQNKLTIYQQLNKFLNLDGFGFQEATPTLPSSVSAPPPKQDRIIIKGNTPQEIHQKGLELEQKRELQNKFFRTTETFKGVLPTKVDGTIDYALNDVFGDNNRENLKKACYNGKQII